MIYDPQYHNDYSSGLTPQQRREFRERYMSKGSAASILLTTLQLCILFVLAGAIHLSIAIISEPACYLVAGFLLLGMARQMRGLENIVHFASHKDISSNRLLNDLSANLLAGWPMLVAVNDYRVVHMPHHGHYGSHLDPCRARFLRMGRDVSDLTSARRLVVVVLRWLPSYVAEYFREMPRKTGSLAATAIWHLAWLVAVAVLWTPAAAIDMAFAWLLAMLVILPPLRSVAEFAEHDYETGGSAATTTYNNLGVANMLLFHPAGDAYHALHHLYPSVPWWKQGAAHRYLNRNDRSYRMVRTRYDILG